MEDAKYFKGLEKISQIVENGVSQLIETNEDFTKLKTPRGGTYIFPTDVFNKLRGYMPEERTILSLTGLGVAQDLRYKSKTSEHYYSKEFD